MHNCKVNRKSLIELVLNEPQSDQNQPLPAELESCATCGEEYASLRNALRLADQGMRSALPMEGFWPSYHASLRRRLESHLSSDVQFESRLPRTSTSLLGILRNLATASVRLPVPVALVLIVLFGLSVVSAMHSRRPSNSQPSGGSPSIGTKIVEVPVVQEKIVTRVVYRERTRRSVRDPATQAEAVRNRPNPVAGRQSERAGEMLVSLVGFKPTNDIKLTIIKGSYRDQK